MQAIFTKFIGPTNFRGSRVKAVADGGTITIGWDHALNPEANYRTAAEALRAKLGWHREFYGDLVSGGAPQGSGWADVFIMLGRPE